MSARCHAASRARPAASGARASRLLGSVLVLYSLFLTCRASAADLPAPGAATPAPLSSERNGCESAAAPVALGSVQWNGWGRDLDNSRYQPEPALRAMDIPRLALRWAYGYQAGTEFGQPTVVDGRLFLTSGAGRVYSVDARTGCTYWTFDAPAGIRGAAVIGELARGRVVALPKKIKRTLAHLDVIKAPSALFFGGDAGMVYAVDAQRGTLLWKTQVESHPLARMVGTPAISGDRLFVTMSSTEEHAAADPAYPCCNFRGSVAALDIATGRLVWKSFTVLEAPAPTRRSAAGVQEFGPAGAAVFCSPTVDPDRKALYVATTGSANGMAQSLTDAVLAFGLADGKLRWVKQLTRPDTGTVGAGFWSAPILRALPTGNQLLLAGQKNGMVYALDPDHGGAVLWQTKLIPAAGPGASPALMPLAGPAAGAGVATGSPVPTTAGAAAAMPVAAGAASTPSVAAGASAPGPAPAAAGVAVLGGIGWGSAADHRFYYGAVSGSLAPAPNAGGSLSALDLKTGVVRWRANAPTPPCAWRGEPICAHGETQAVTVIPGGVFSGALDGHLRAYSTIDGRILWDFDTAKEYTTRNGVRASGGPLDRGGATLVNGTLYVNSGNALLAFSVDGN